MAGAARKFKWLLGLLLGSLLAGDQARGQDQELPPLPDTQRAETVERPNPVQQLTQPPPPVNLHSTLTTRPAVAGTIDLLADRKKEEDIQKRIEDAVARRFEQEKKKQEDKDKEAKAKKEEEEKEKKDKEEAAKKEEEQTRELLGFEVGKNLDLKGTWNNGMWLSSADQAFRFHLGGRVDYDTVFFNQDPNLRFGSDNTTMLRDGSDFRRLRLRAEGSFWENVDFLFEVNFANFQDFSNADQDIVVGSVGLTDMWATFRDLPLVGNLRLGHFQPPISLEHLTSTNYFYYMERSPGFDAFINRFDYVDGAMLFDSFFNDRATLSGAVMRTGSTTVNPFGAGAGPGRTVAQSAAPSFPLPPMTTENCCIWA